MRASVRTASRPTSVRSSRGCAVRTRRCGWSGRSSRRPRFFRPGNRRAVGEIFALIEAERTSFPVAVMCRALGVNRTSFHDWERRAPSDRALSDAWLTEKIKQIHAASDGTYGARRVHAELRLEHGVRVGRKRVERLMKAAGISGVVARKRRRGDACMAPRKARIRSRSFPA